MNKMEAEIETSQNEKEQSVEYIYLYGIINKKDAKNHKLKNIITRSVGYQEVVEIDLKNYEVHMGDRLLLCSDGLTNMLDDEEIRSLVIQHPIKEACKKLIDAANAKGGEDNITALLVEVSTL